MSTIYLYIKQHTITKLKYFGKTIKDPYTYQGSGVYWNRHIDKYGRKYIKTVKVWKFDNQSECTKFAINFSRKHNVVNSSTWANLMEENGTTGGAVKNNHFRVFNLQPKSDQWKANQSKKKLGKIISHNSYTEEANNKRSSTLKEHPIVSCPHCGKSGRLIGRFKGSHFEKCKSTT